MSQDRTPAGRTPAQTAALVGLVMLGAILTTLAVMLVITWMAGDPTDDLHERQPTREPVGTSAPPGQ